LTRIIIIGQLKGEQLDNPKILYVIIISKYVDASTEKLYPSLKKQCHAIWQFYKKLEGVFALIEFQK